MAQRQSSVNVNHHLKGIDFPASKADLLVHARDNGAGQDTLEVLESFPNGEEFGSLAEVEGVRESDRVPQTGIIDRKP